jgi:hypothetical protein
MNYVPSYIRKKQYTSYRKTITQCIILPSSYELLTGVLSTNGITQNVPYILSFHSVTALYKTTVLDNELTCLGRIMVQLGPFECPNCPALSPQVSTARWPQITV